MASGLGQTASGTQGTTTETQSKNDSPAGSEYHTQH